MYNDDDYRQREEEYRRERDAAKLKRKKKIIGGFTALIIIFLGIIIFNMCSERIEPGYAGVVYNMNGGVEDKALGQGLKFVAPWKDITAYPVATETVYLSKNSGESGDTDKSFNISTKDGKPVNVDVSYSYHMDINHLADIFTKFKRQDTAIIEDVFIRQRVKDAINNTTCTYGISEVYGEKRGEISDKIEAALKADLKNSHIILEGFSFSDVRPDENTMQSINAKVAAQQKLEQAKIDRDKAVILAEKRRIEAQDKADANVKMQQSITPELIQYTLAEKWDGKAPLVNGGNGTMIDVSKLVK